MITGKEAGTLEYFFDTLLRVTTLAVESEVRNDEIQLAKFGLTLETLATNNLPWRSKSTVYFVDKRWSLIASQKRFHEALQDGSLTVAEFLEEEKKFLERLRNNFTKLGNTGDLTRSGFEGQEAALVSVIDLLEEVAAGKA
jgi:hypothetical protein